MEGCSATYTGHEETECTTETETHCTGDDCLDGAGLHTGLHLFAGFVSQESSKIARGHVPS